MHLYCRCNKKKTFCFLVVVVVVGRWRSMEHTIGEVCMDMCVYVMRTHIGGGGGGYIVMLTM